jgi:F-type H+-transporting ATPase subunit gamma
VASLKEVRVRIESIKSTQQITSAMKLVAASKLRRTQNAVQALAPYAAKLREILGNLSSSLEDTDEAIYSAARPVEKVLLVVITSNRGLCGPFNGNVIKAAKLHIEQNFKEINQKGNLDIYTIGKKGNDFFKKNKYNVVNSNIAIFDALTFANTTVIAEELMAAYATKKYDRIEIIYNHFKNAAQQVLQIEQYLPISSVPDNLAIGRKPVQPAAPPEAKKKADYIFEPEKNVLVRELIPRILKMQLYKAVLDSYAAEHGARMTAMSQATDNARDILRQLQLSYNKARQAAITKELLEIVSGAEALKG